MHTLQSMSAERLTHRGRRTYNNASNKKKIRITPGGRRVYLPEKKKGIVAKCSKCKVKLNGISCLRPSERSKVKKSFYSVSRLYGGKFCSECLKSRIIEKFLLSEEIKMAGNVEEEN